MVALVLAAARARPRRTFTDPPFAESESAQRVPKAAQAGVSPRLHWGGRLLTGLTLVWLSGLPQLEAAHALWLWIGYDAGLWRFIWVNQTQTWHCRHGLSRGLRYRSRHRLSPARTFLGDHGMYRLHLGWLAGDLAVYLGQNVLLGCC